MDLLHQRTDRELLIGIFDAVCALAAKLTGEKLVVFLPSAAGDWPYSGSQCAWLPMDRQVESPSLDVRHESERSSKQPGLPQQKGEKTLKVTRPMVDAGKDGLPKWRVWFPDLQIPVGLTFEDLSDAAAAIRAWGDEEESTAIPLVAELFERLRERAARPPSDSMSIHYGPAWAWEWDRPEAIEARRQMRASYERYLKVLAEGG